MPYLVNEEEPGERERLQSPEDRDRFEDTTKCILCAACTTSCPVFWTADTYVGPAAIVNAHRFVFDSRDNASKQRLEILKDVNGAFRCITAFNCTTACPLPSSTSLYSSLTESPFLNAKECLSQFR